MEKRRGKASKLFATFRRGTATAWPCDTNQSDGTCQADAVPSRP